MRAPLKERLQELQAIISKMSLNAICTYALPTLGLRWREVSQAVRNSRMRMTPGSVARILAAHVAKTRTDDELRDILTRITIQHVATSDCVWRVIKLLEPAAEPEPAHVWVRELRGRVLRAARRAQRGLASIEVHSECIGDFVYLSVRRATDVRVGTPLYVAAAASQPFAFVTRIPGALMQPIVEGLGYKKHQDASLYGRDIASLLRIVDRAWNVNPSRLTEIPPYDPSPVVTKNSIDYTNKAYDEAYVDTLIGPDPPLLTNLDINSTKPYFDPSRLNKNMTIIMTLKSDDVAATLKQWVAVKAIPPTSDFFRILHDLRSNKLTYSREERE